MTENIRAPKAQMPKQIKISCMEGVYSIIEPRGEGTNPGMISPVPFSIQIPINPRRQADIKNRLSFLNLGTLKTIQA
jgi:hypothetical protein